MRERCLKPLTLAHIKAVERLPIWLCDFFLCTAAFVLKRFWSHVSSIKTQKPCTWNIWRFLTRTIWKKNCGVLKLQLMGYCIFQLLLWSWMLLFLQTRKTSIGESGRSFPSAILKLWAWNAFVFFKYSLIKLIFLTSFLFSVRWSLKILISFLKLRIHFMLIALTLARGIWNLAFTTL